MDWLGMPATSQVVISTRSRRYNRHHRPPSTFDLKLEGVSAANVMKAKRYRIRRGAQY